MKVIIPIENSQQKQIKLSNGFHSTEELCVYDTMRNEISFLSSKELYKHIGNITSELKNRGINVAVTYEMSFMALSVFVCGGINVFKSEGLDLYHNIELLKQNKLTLYNSLSTYKTAGCSTSSCESCNTVCETQ